MSTQLCPSCGMRCVKHRERRSQGMYQYGLPAQEVNVSYKVEWWCRCGYRELIRYFTDSENQADIKWETVNELK